MIEMYRFYAGWQRYEKNAVRVSKGVLASGPNTRPN